MSSYYTVHEMHSVKLLEKCLENSVLECIENLEHIVSESTRKQHRFDRKRSNDFRPRQTFQQTIIKKPETDVDAKLNEIRVAMNKVSSKNKEQQQEILINALSELKAMNHEMRPVYFMILNVASSNKFGNEVYMDIIRSIMEKNSDFDITLQYWYDDYMRTIEGIKYASGDTDYDAFCQYNKTNDLLKARTSFIVELFKADILDREYMNSISMFIVTTMFVWCETGEKPNEVEELIELLYVIASKEKSLGFFFKIDMEKFGRLKKCNPEKYKAITSRSTFRSMDIIDLLKD